MSDIHNCQAMHYGYNVERTLGKVTMSSANSVLQSALTRTVNTRLDIDESDDVGPSAIEKVDFSLLQIDESYEVDCDPYNSTGQAFVAK